VLRAMRRENASGSPSTASKGCTVTTSAPPTPAAKQATVVRSRFTHGSRRVVMTDEVTACCRCPRASADAPLTSPTRSHSRRAARSPAIVVNWSAQLIAAELQQSLQAHQARLEYFLARTRYAAAGEELLALRDLVAGRNDAYTQWLWAVARELPSAQAEQGEVQP